MKCGVGQCCHCVTGGTFILPRRGRSFPWTGAEDGRGRYLKKRTQTAPGLCPLHLLLRLPAHLAQLRAGTASALATGCEVVAFDMASSRRDDGGPWTWSWWKAPSPGRQNSSRLLELRRRARLLVAVGACALSGGVNALGGGDRAPCCEQVYGETAAAKTPSRPSPCPVSYGSIWRLPAAPRNAVSTCGPSAPGSGRIPSACRSTPSAWNAGSRENLCLLHRGKTALPGPGDPGRLQGPLPLLRRRLRGLPGVGGRGQPGRGVPAAAGARPLRSGRCGPGWNASPGVTMKTISLEPLTRVEGHGRVELVLGERRLRRCGWRFSNPRGSSRAWSSAAPSARCRRWSAASAPSVPRRPPGRRGRRPWRGRSGWKSPRQRG